jgi:hypothetical protein
LGKEIDKLRSFAPFGFRLCYLETNYSFRISSKSLNSHVDS